MCFETHIKLIINFRKISPMKKNQSPRCTYPFCENNDGSKPKRCMASTFLENQAEQGGYGMNDMGSGPYMDQTRWEKIYNNISSNALKHLCFLAHTLPELCARLTEDKQSRGELK